MTPQVIPAVDSISKIPLLGGFTALHMAVAMKSKASIRHLLEHGADVHKDLL